MKRTLLIVLACVGILASSCKKEEPVAIDVQTLVGVWGATESKQVPADGAYVCYFRFNADQTIETYSLYESGCAYNIGLYGIRNNNNQVHYTYSEIREYAYYGGVTRYVCHINDDRRTFGFTVKEVSENMIRYENSNGEYYLHKITDIPSNWNAECSSPSVEATAENIASQWDFVNVYRLEGNGQTTYWNISSPETEGMILQSGGIQDKCQFWINYLYYKLIAEQKIANGKHIYISYADCRWSLDKSLTLSCSRYQIGTSDASGQFVAEQEVVPEEPVQAEFAIHALTDYYMILSAYDYQLKTTGYYAFHRNSGAKANMPEKQSISGAASQCSNCVQEMKSCRKISFLQ